MSAPEAVETVIIPPTRDLGDGFKVQRALPSLQRRTVGPFVFFDRMGPTRLRAGTGLDVRPHPHIGLATVTYLLEGEILHRDSLGSVQAIRPGEVNWMVAGRGIVHSERTDATQRQHESPLDGVQTWVALPRAREECAPSFSHHAAAELPLMEADGARIRLIAGSLFGARSPVITASAMFYADATLGPGARLALPLEHAERALYLLQGSIEIDAQPFGSGQLVVLKPDQALVVRAPQGARLLLLGGEPMDGERYLWWNFVSSSRERIEQAKLDWREGRIGRVPGDPEFIPLPQ